MLRRIIQIDEDRCNGCGLCVKACHEGAIALQNGKAVLIRDDYCDGLGDCLPNCPQDAIHFIEKDTLPYDDAAVKAHLAKKGPKIQPSIRPVLKQDHESELTNWPIQLQLVSADAGFFDGADLLIAADCAAFAHPHFQQTFMKDKAVLIACPKLDTADYASKLAAIFRNHMINSVSVVRMEVPCCKGLANMVKQALEKANSDLELLETVITVDGRVL